MPSTLDEKDWEALIKRINDGKCTPVIGAGACYRVTPLGSEIAQKWAKDYDYPFEDHHDLARVADFLAVELCDPMFPKEEIVRMLNEVQPPDFNEPDEPHSVLASLPFPVYITTNYDDFMIQALKSRNKDPKLELCLWNKYIKNKKSVFISEPEFEPTSESPVVFHLYGHISVPESLVITEDDYLDFLVNISRDKEILPSLILKAFSGALRLFIGYRETDWNFRVLFRAVDCFAERSLRHINVAINFPSEDSKPVFQNTQNYLTKYFRAKDKRVWWGTIREFAMELRQRWEIFSSSQ